MKKILPVFESLLILVLVAAAMIQDLDQVEFHPDESHWIGLSAPFEAFFKGSFEKEYWQNLFSAYLNPPVTYYAVGLARRIGGYRPGDLNPVYNFKLSAQENADQGRIPSPNLLWWGRLGVTACAVLGIWIAVSLLKQASGRWIAYSWLVFLLLNTAFMRMLRRAMNEGVLILFVMASIGAAWQGLRIFAKHPNPFKSPKLMAWLVLSGLAAGLAGQTKTNGAIIVFGAWLVYAAAAFRFPSPWHKKLIQAALAGFLLGGSFLITFIGANPLLWHDPIQGLRESFTQRSEIMARQVASFEKDHIDSPRERVEIFSRRLFTDQGILPQPMPNSLFFLAGLVLVLQRLIEWLRGKNDNHALAALFIAGFVVGLPVFFTPLNWDRYYLPISFFTGMITLLGAGLVIDWLITQIRNTDLLRRDLA